MRALLLVPLAALGLAACEASVPRDPALSGPTGGTGTPEQKTPAKPPVPQRMPLGPVATRLYLSQLAPYLVGRELSTDELSQAEALGELAIEPMLKAWTAEPGFVEYARSIVQQKLSVSGTKGGVDFELPGNLAAYLVKNQLPLKNLLTADYCVSAAGAKIDCDSGAPFKAGVLTTRAFLMSRASRFNLTRASTLLKVFACRGYPMEDDLQPRLERTTLIPMFQAQVPEEQTDPLASNGFGNGFACYTCHGQFSAHAQVFVKFDSAGMYRETASGLQDPAGELGRSTNELFASHLKDPAAAKMEASQIFGKSVANLAEAAQVLAESPTFLRCQSRNLLELTLGLDPASPISATVLEKVAEAATAANPEPTFADLTVATFTNVKIIDAVAAGIGATP